MPPENKPKCKDTWVADLTLPLFSCVNHLTSLSLSCLILEVKEFLRAIPAVKFGDPKL